MWKMSGACSVPGYACAGLIALSAVCASPVPAQAQAAPPALDVALPVSAVGAPTPAAAAPDPANGSATPLADTDTADPGEQVYRHMVQYLASQRTYFVELSSTHTITGQAVPYESGSLSRVWFSRPQRMVWTTQSDLGSSAMAIDEKESTLYLPTLSKYTVTPVTAENIDGQISAMAAPYGVLTTALFSPQTTTALTAILDQSPRLQGEAEALGVPCYHLVVPTLFGEADLWVARGQLALPIKIAYSRTLPSSPGQPADLRSHTEISFLWRVNVDLPDSTFQLKIPETAKKADRLGAPVQAPKPRAIVRTPAPGVASSSSSSSRGRSGSASASGASRAATGGAQGKTKTGKDLGLAYDLPSALDAHSHGAAPSLQGRSEEALIEAAIRGSRPDSVPSRSSFQPEQDQAAPPPPSSSARTADARLAMLDGRTVQLSQFRGKKAVILDFWATWCGPCKQSLPVVNQVAAAYQAHNVEVIAVNMAEDAGTIQGFLRKQGLSLPVALDSDGRLAGMFGVSGIPHLIVIGRDGTIKATHTGSDPALAQKLARDIQTALQ